MRPTRGLHHSCMAIRKGVWSTSKPLALSAGQCTNQKELAASTGAFFSAVTEIFQSQTW